MARLRRKRASNVGPAAAEGCFNGGVLQDLSTDLAEPTHSCVSIDLEAVQLVLCSR